MDNVIPISRALRRPQVKTVVKVAETGSKPFLVHATDGKQYWCKYLHSPHGEASVVNEIVVSVIGKAIGAPVMPWELLDVPDSLVGTSIGAGESRMRMPTGPLFGSQLLNSAIFQREAVHVADDGNYNRFPLLIALAELCEADDVQYLYDSATDHQVWSIDYGMWFGSYEVPWDFLAVEGIGRLHGTIPATHWDKAIEAVQNLDDSIISDIHGAVPDEWGIASADLDKLAHFCLSRKNATIQLLTDTKNRHGRGAAT